MKLPFKFDFDEFEEDYPAIKNQRFFGFKQLSLASNYGDPAGMRDSLVYELLEESGLPSLRPAPYALVLDYGAGPVRLGLYTMVEVVSCAFVDLRPAVLSSWRQQGTPGRSVHPMAKPTKKQQRHGLKKQKAR